MLRSCNSASTSAKSSIIYSSSSRACNALRILRHDLSPAFAMNVVNFSDHVLNSSSVSPSHKPGLPTCLLLKRTVVPNGSSSTTTVSMIVLSKSRNSEVDAKSISTFASLRIFDTRCAAMLAQQTRAAVRFCLR